jgi:hypothetical protein
MIICAYCGRENDQGLKHCGECGTELPKPTALQSATIPELPPPRFFDAASASGAFREADGFQRADWQVIEHWIEVNVSLLGFEAARNEAALYWIGLLRDDLGASYYVLTSTHAVLLTDKPLETARWLLSYIERVDVTIRARLSGVAWRGASAKKVVLIFSELDDYYQYLAYYLKEGVQPASGGVCIPWGFTHVAMPWRDEASAANTIVHELTHDCLAHKPLPRWLDEGVAMTLERAIGPPHSYPGQGEQNLLYTRSINWQPPLMWEELAERHFAFWTEEKIQHFWAGTSFYEPGDSNELSYSLGEVLVKLLSERPGFIAFLEKADQGDAGQTAALDILGIDLGDTAATFLGKGNWRPRRKAMAELWRTAGWDEDSRK